jgi:MFS family permease
MTPVLAAGFNNVAETYDVTVPQVALTTGLYMLGLGMGSVVASPTAILYGKRPVYLTAIIVFLLSSVWCALSPNCMSDESQASTQLILRRCIPCRCSYCTGHCRVPSGMSTLSYCC